MTDNTKLNKPTSDGDIIATDDITGGVADGAKVQRIKSGHGVGGSYVDTSDADPLPTKLVGETSGESVRVTKAALNTQTQDQYTRALDLRFIMSTGVPSFLDVATVVDSHEITLVDATGFVAGSYIVIAEAGDKFFVGTQLGAAVGNVITVDSPIDQIYSVGVVVLNTTYAMNVNGAITSKTFQIGSSSSTVELDITRIMGYMLDTDTMDDSKFGSLAALTNGCVLRLTNGTTTNTWNVKSNGDLALLGFDLVYPDKPPAGKNSARFRITYAGPDKHGVTLRLGAGDFLEFIIQDDLTGLEIFNMMGQGHVVE